MRRYLVNTLNTVGKPYIVAEIGAQYVVWELAHVGDTYDENATRLMFPEALDAWQARDDSVEEEDEDLCVIEQAHTAMEIERYRTMSFDEFLDEMMSSPEYKSLEGDELNSMRAVMTFYYWKDRPGGLGGNLHGCYSALRTLLSDVRGSGGRGCPSFLSGATPRPPPEARPSLPSKGRGCKLARSREEES